MNRRLNIIIGIIVSGFFIYLAAKNVNIWEILASLKRANYLLIIPNVIFVLALMYIRAIRWRYLMAPIGNYRPKKLFPSVMIGFMANNILPARLGEIVRAYSLGAKTGESRTAIFATVVLERIFDSLALLAMFWLVILFVPFPKYIKDFGIITLIFNIILILILVLLKIRTPWLVRIALTVFFFLPQRYAIKIEHIITKFALGLDVVKNIKMLFYISFWSIIIWLITAISNYFVFMAFDIYPNLAASFILLLFVAAGVMLPSAPGFVGVFQAATIGAFGLMNTMGLLGSQLSERNIQSAVLTVAGYNAAPFMAPGPIVDSIGILGISKSEALSFSIILWLCQFIPVTLLGLYYLKKEHFTLKELQK